MATEAAQRAKKIREQLKAAFPGIKFSVRTHNYSGGDSITIRWTDGPKGDDVKAIARQHETIHYDHNVGEILSGGNSYVNTSRTYTVEAYEAALKAVCKYWGLEVPEFTTQDGGSPYLSFSQDINNVGNGIKRLSELVNERLYETDLRPTEDASPAAPAPSDEPASDMEVVENDDRDGFELYFNGKPDDGLRQILKENGFRPAKKKTGDRVGQWFWYATRSDERREFIANLANLFAPEHPATIGGNLPGTIATYTEFMKATGQPKARRTEDRDGKLIGGQFEYEGRLFLVEPVNDVAKGYKTVGFHLIIGGHSRPILAYQSDRPNSYFRSVSEARRAAFWYLSGADPLTLDLAVFTQIFRTTDQIAWLLETVGGTTFRNQLVDRDLAEWSHDEIATEALALLKGRYDGPTPSLKAPAPTATPAQPEPPAPAPKADPKLAKRAKSFREMADRLQATIDQKLAPRLENTHRRAEEARQQRNDGYRLQRVQAVLRTIAGRCEDGTIAHPLTVISSKSQIEGLMGYAEKIDMTEAEAMNHRAIADGWRPEQVIKSYGIASSEILDGTYTALDSERAKLKLTPAQFVELLQNLKAIANGEVEIDHEAEELKRLLAGLNGCRIDGYVPTPELLGQQAIEMLDITDDDYVLDPQGGDGALLRVIRDRHPGARLATFECSDTLRKILTLQGFDVLGDDSMEYRPERGDRPTKIAMNPPFEGMADIDHVRHDYDILAPGGRMVAIMSASPFFQSRKKATQFRAWLDEVPTVIYCEKNAADAFKTSGTTIQTYLMVLQKPLEVAEPVEIPALPPLPETSPLGQLCLALF